MNINQLEDSSIGKVTHQGKWKVYDGLEIECYVTDKGYNTPKCQDNFF